MKTMTLWMALAALLCLAAAAHADDDAATLVDLQFEDAPVPTVIAEIARLGGVNIIVGPKAAAGTITVKLHKVPWTFALEQVAAARGLQLHYEEDGIVRVVKKPVPVVKKPVRVVEERVEVEVGGKKTPAIRFRTRDEADARKRIEATLEEARRRVAALEAELAEARKTKKKARVAELRVQLERVRHDIEVVRRHAADEGKRRPAAPVMVEGRSTTTATKTAKYPQQQANQYVQIFAVQDLDLDQTGVADTLAALEREGALVQFDDGKLIVRCTGLQQKRLRAALAKARGGSAAYGSRKVGPGGKPGVRGRVVDEQGRPVKPGVFVSGNDGTSWVRLGHAAQQAAAAKKRVLALQQAAKLLDEAGAKAEATRVRAQAQAALAELRRAESARRAAEIAQVEATRAKRVALGKRHGSARRSDEAGLAEGITALRQDVAALRGEVRELTGLVRRLLGRRGAEGAAGRGGDGGAGGGR